MILQVDGRISSFFDRVPGEDITVAYGVVAPLGDDTAPRPRKAEQRRWQLSDIRHCVMRIEKVRYDYSENAGRVVRLHGEMDGMKVRLYAYTLYGTAVLLVG